MQGVARYKRLNTKEAGIQLNALFDSENVTSCGLDSTTPDHIGRGLAGTEAFWNGKEFKY